MKFSFTFLIYKWYDCFSGAEVSDCGSYLIITPVIGCKDNLLYFAHLNGDIKGKLKLHEVVTVFDADFEVRNIVN